MKGTKQNRIESLRFALTSVANRAHAFGVPPDLVLAEEIASWCLAAAGSKDEDWKEIKKQLWDEILADCNKSITRGQNQSIQLETSPKLTLEIRKSE